MIAGDYSLAAFPRFVCQRCGLIDPALSAEWEVVGGDVVCPVCVTGAEEQAIFEDYAEGLDFEDDES